MCVSKQLLFPLVAMDGILIAPITLVISHPLVSRKHRVLSPLSLEDRDVTTKLYSGGKQSRSYAFSYLVVEYCCVSWKIYAISERYFGKWRKSRPY